MNASIKICLIPVSIARHHKLISQQHKTLKVKGEFKLISFLKTYLEKKSPPDPQNVIRSIGDDCAVFKGELADYLVTTDLLVEDVHFKISTIDPVHLGYKALAVNISDIAAMAGTPLYAVIQLSFPPDMPQQIVEKIYKGISQAASEFSVSIIGGDITSSEKVFIGATVIGKKADGGKNYRNSGEDGDHVLVTGELGLSALGLKAERDERLADALKPSIIKKIIKAHYLPTPRINEAIIAAENGANAMIDISDGLFQDLGHILDESHLFAIIEKEAIPFNRKLEQIVKPLGYDLYDLAVSGGEDYELIITAPKKFSQKLAEEVTKKTGTPVTIIGEIIRGGKQSYLRKADGTLSTLDRSGFDHFRGHSTQERS